MKEIIPLKKDIVFKTKIGVLTNLNLDHDYKIDDELISGTVALSGTYKMTEASVVEDDFFYTIPFSIAISKRINKDTIKIEIDDFKYEILRDTLKINVDLELTCEEIENEESSLEVGNDIKEDELDNYIDDYFESDNEKVEVKNEENSLDINTSIQNITNNIINTDEKYYTYKIYIARQGDTYETICSKYNISYDELKEYNDLTDINVGDKIIIPSMNE